jgi:prepilin-type N-terminal cleavage/methylation domain-containing protein
VPVAYLQQERRFRVGAGLRARPRRAERGITLIELLVAMAIVALMLGIAFPSMTAGLDSIVLHTDMDRAGTFFSQARLSADRLQQPVQLTSDPEKGQLTAVSVDGSWEDTLAFSSRVHVAFPAKKQSVILHPSTPAPQYRLLLESERGTRAGLSINIFTGTPEEWKPSEEDLR